MTEDHEEHKLDELLKTLKTPVPAQALENVRQRIHANLEWRTPMTSRLMLQRSTVLRLSPAIAAASILLCAYVVGLALQDARSLGFAGRGAMVGGDEMIAGQKLKSPVCEKKTLMHMKNAKGLSDKMEEIGVKPDPVVVTADFQIADHNQTSDEMEKVAATCKPDSISRFEKEEDGEPELMGVGMLTPSERGRLTRFPAKGAVNIGGCTDVDVVFREGGEDQAGVKSRNAYKSTLARLNADRKTARGRFDRKPLHDRGRNQRRLVKTRSATAAPKPASKPLQKIIKTAELKIEVRKFAPASARVDGLVTRFGGFYADSSVQQNDDHTTSARFVIRVPQRNFEALYAALKQIGKVKAENAKGEDVTAQYADIDARIRNAQHLEKRLLALLEEKRRKDKMSEILEVEREIARVRQEVEKYQGRMRVMQDKISLGTIYLSLSEPRRSVPHGSIDLEADDVQQAGAGLDNLVRSAGGRVIRRDISRNAEGGLRMEMTLELPLSAYGKVVTGMHRLGRVVSQDLQGYNLAPAVQDPGAAAVNGTLQVTMREPGMQQPAGSARIEVRTLKEAAQTIAGLIGQYQASVKSREEQRVDGGANATYVLRVPRKNYGAVANALSTIGRVADRQFRGVDVVSRGGRWGEVLCDMTLVLFERSRQQPTATASISTPSLDAAAQKIRALLASVDGQVKSHVEQRRPQGGGSASYVLRCRRARFAEMIGGLAGVGRVVNQQVRGLDLEPVAGAAADVLCTLNLSVRERRAPVPAAKLVLVVRDAADATGKLRALRDTCAAQTMGVYTNQKSDGSMEQDWRLRVSVDRFEDFVNNICKLGHVRVRQVRGVGSGADEKPDPKALADVAVKLTQRSPYAPPEEETSGSIRHAVRSAWKHFYASIGVIVYGLIVIAPWLLVIVGVHFGVRRWRR